MHLITFLHILYKYASMKQTSHKNIEHANASISFCSKNYTAFYFILIGITRPL